MDKRRLVKKLKEERRKLLQAAQALSPSQRETPFLGGKWSAKDVLAHIAAWDREQLKGVQQLLRGERPGFLDFDWDEFNARAVAARHGASFEAIVKETEQTLDEFIATLESIPEEEFAKLRGLRWKRWEVTLEWVVSGTYTHDAEHRQQLKEFLRS
jgi:uncharacterized damage-inducible protein DinB